MCIRDRSGGALSRLQGLSPVSYTHLDVYKRQYLVDETGRRVAAFGYWAGYAGAAVSLKCWAAQQRGGIAGPVSQYPGKAALLADLARDLADFARPRAIVIGALGRVGTGASDPVSYTHLDVYKRQGPICAHNDDITDRIIRINRRQRQHNRALAGGEIEQLSLIHI